MTDRPDSIPTWEEAPFRECFLAAFVTEPRHLSAVREFGSFLYQSVAEASLCQPEAPGWSVELLRAFAADVGYSARMLRGTLVESSGSPWEKSLAGQADRWAAQLAAVSADMEAFLALSAEPS
ncbi:MAG TPA: hypothetical protein VF017_06035 [Thermoanaerobaculia bacterium]|nr:hypothetical protein [Thermoanaerobaculia bacterium]